MHALEAYRGEEVQLHSFPSAPDGNKSASWRADSPLVKKLLVLVEAYIHVDFLQESSTQNKIQLEKYIQKEHLNTTYRFTIETPVLSTTKHVNSSHHATYIMINKNSSKSN